MTATDRELLAHAIWTTGRTRAIDRFPLADALMPVVEAIARRRAAEELRAAADEDTVSSRALNEPGFADLRVVKAGDLRERADALTDHEETL